MVPSATDKCWPGFTAASITLLPLFLGLLLGVAGCASEPTAQDRAAEERQRMLDEQEDNKVRLVVEDKRPQTAMEQTWGAVVHVIWDEPLRWWDLMMGNTPGAAARQMEDKTSPDVRRVGVFALVDYSFAREDPYTKRYAQIAQLDEDYTVRAAAIRALNRSRSREGSKVFIHALQSEFVLERLEAAKAIANIPDPQAVPVLLLHLSKEDNKDVRIACADALRNYQTMEVARSLVEVLSDRDFGVAWQAHRSLRIMTAVDLGYNGGAWLDYLKSQKTFGQTDKG